MYNYAKTKWKLRVVMSTLDTNTYNYVRWIYNRVTLYNILQMVNNYTSQDCAYQHYMELRRTIPNYKNEART